jgi:hypothetical protein
VHVTNARATSHPPGPASFKLAGHWHEDGAAPVWTSGVMAAPSVEPTPLLVLLHPTTATSSVAPHTMAIVVSPTD